MSKTWFIAPSFDFSPDGPISLGAIITNAAQPQATLNYHERIPPPQDDLINGPTSDLQGEWKKVQERQGGVWARILELVINPSLNRQASKEMFLKYKFKEISTTRFEPTLSYVKRAIEAPQVLEYVKSKSFNSPVYMVTGVKVAKNADVSWVRKDSWQVDARVGIEVDVYGGPILLATGFAVRDAEEQQNQQNSLKDVVIAFHLREIHYDRGGSIRHQTFQEGNFLGREDKNETADPRKSICVLGLRTWDVTKEDFEENVDTAEDD